MLIAARNGMMADGKLSAKSYIQDGLVAMWDGVENAGWGVHDPNATVWKDLSNSGLDLDVVGLSIGLDYLYMQGTIDNYNLSMRAYSADAMPSFLTVEVVFGLTNYKVNFNENNNRTTIAYLGDSTRMISSYNNFALSFGNGSVSISDFRTKPEVQGVFYPTSISYVYSPKYAYRDGASVSVGSNNSYGSASGIVIGSFRRTNPVRYHCIRCYASALTADEIAANYAVDKARFGLP